MNQTPMPQGPLVSVIVPTRDRRELLGQCLAALARQTYEPFEVIVVDDGSIDGTPEMLQEFRGSNPTMDLKVLRNDSPKGANPSRNRGLAMSRGDFIAFEDDDCIAQPTWIERLVAGFAEPAVAAVTGLVLDPPPRNIYDLAFRGTHRVYGGEHATRLVNGNVCVRRPWVLGALDEDRAGVSNDMSVSGRGDEEGLYLRIKAAGHRVRFASDAVVLHVHHYTRTSFFRQAYKGGKSAARVGYKYGLRLRPELVCLMLGYLSLAAALLWHPLASAPAGFCFVLFLGAITYNELWRKGKNARETMISYPVVLAYYHVRTLGYFGEWIRLLSGMERLTRVRLRQ